MKTLLMFFVCAVACLVPMSNASHDVKFSIAGFFPESRTEAAVIRTSEEMDAFIQETLNEVRERSDAVMLPFVGQFEETLRNYYAEYDACFFEENNLIIALLERGSGSLRFSLEELALDGDTLKITVLRNSPMIQTMDYRTHAMQLSVCKKLYDAPKAEVNIVR